MIHSRKAPFCNRIFDIRTRFFKQTLSYLIWWRKITIALTDSIIILTSAEDFEHDKKPWD